MNFNNFALNQNILKALEDIKYTKTTSIQEKVIPLILKGEDILAKSQTGSGKTASFVLPILNQFIEDEKVKVKKKAFISTIILTPTRDLTIQVAQTFELFSKYLDKKPKVVTVIGGLEIQQQLLDIQSGCDIVVATSGRLLDIIDKKQINLSFVKNFILDEADKMLDLGFADELDLILEELPKQRQNLLFSATYPDKMMKIASKITASALKVEIQKEAPTVQDIEQRVIEVNKENRSPLLRFLLKTNKWNQVLVFMANKRATDNIAAKFRKHGYLAESFHGDLDQEDRNYTLDEFKKKNIKILFCTDIASRGLHIDDISCVINFDLPRGTDSYVHRIGRTGRAGKKGEAITFIDHEDIMHFKLIEKRCNLDITYEQIEGFELRGEIKAKEKGSAPIKGKRKSKKDKLREELAKKGNNEV
ncbi:MAG TPA: DEAD/DEAH box helicase [Arcobacter sp.]|nr:DEAD/DEAH box helicase [Arcobacter sp.]